MSDYIRRSDLESGMLVHWSGADRDRATCVLDQGHLILTWTINGRPWAYIADPTFPEPSSLLQRAADQSA